MGIKCLLKFINEFPDLIKFVDRNSLNKKRIAIDISILIYRIIISVRNSGADFTNQKGEITSHILGLFNKTIEFLSLGIIPVYVFDGKPPSLKYKTIEERKEGRKKALEKMEQSISEDEKIKYFKRSSQITKEQWDQCRDLLDIMGIPYVNAPEEADSQCAYLVKQGLVDSVLTEDMDINCGEILDGTCLLHEMGKRIFDLMLRVASGEPTKSELLGLGDHEFVPWNIGVVG
jgi:flap endonuclease-1